MCPAEKPLGLRRVQHAFFQRHLPARGARRQRVKAPGGTLDRGNAPAQRRGAGLASGAIAQQQERGAATGAAQAQPPAGGKIDRLVVAGNIGDHGGDGAAGQGLFGGPEQFGDGGGAHQYQSVGVEAEADEAGAIGQAHFLGLAGELQIDHGRARRGDQAARLGQGKAEGGAGMAALGGKDFLQLAGGGQGKAGRIGMQQRARFGQSRLALDIGNGIAQRGKALLAVRRAHGPRPFHVNKQRTTRLRIRRESSPFSVPWVWPLRTKPGQERVSQATGH